MKKIILFALVIFVMCSCNGTSSDEIRADFMCAFTDYDVRESQINCEYTIKIYQSRGEYKSKLKEVSDTLTNVFENVASECFDSLYIKYGNSFVKKMVYHQAGKVFDNKEMLHKYYVSKSVSKVMNNVALQVRAHSVLYPSEEDKVETIREVFEKGSFFISD